MTKTKLYSLCLGETLAAMNALEAGYTSLARECVDQAFENLARYNYAPGTPVSDDELLRACDYAQGVLVQVIKAEAA